MSVLTAKQIADAKTRTRYSLSSQHHEHDDCIRIAYEWLDAQVKTKTTTSHANPIKHIIENWGGRYVSTSDVEVAATLHPDIIGDYPRYNISSRLTLPAARRLDAIGEAHKHGKEPSQNTYRRVED